MWVIIGVIRLIFVIPFWLIRGLVWGFTPSGQYRRAVRRELKRGGYSGRHRGREDGATFWRGADAVEGRPRLSPLYGRPGYVRVIARLVLVVLALAAGWAAIFHRAELVTAVRITGAMLAAGILGLGVWRWRFRSRRRRRAALFVAVSRILGLPPAAGSMRRWLRFHGDECAEDGIIRVNVPDDFLGNPPTISGLTQLMNDRLPGEWEIRPHLDALFLEFAHPPRPPDIVRYADVEAAFTGGREHILPLGLSDRGAMVSVDLTQDSPHVAIVAGSGGGKSTQLALQVARFLHTGAERVDILDIRRTSQMELADVPNVHIHRTVEECVAAIANYRAEVEHRQEITEQLRQREYDGPRWVLAVEEMSTLTEEIRSHWKATKSRKDPAEPPALRNIAFLASIGRASKITMLVVMQYGSARVFGGPAVKSNFAALILLRFRPAAWRLLVGTTPIPASPSAPGRGWVVTGESERLVQLVYATPAEVVTLATTGANEHAPAEPIGPGEMPGPDVRVSETSGSARRVELGGWVPDIPDMRTPPRTPPEPEPAPVAPAEPTPPSPVPPPGERPRRTQVPHPPPRVVGWRAAAELLGTTETALTRAASRDPDFPDGERIGRQRSWTAEELHRWQAARPIAGKRGAEPEKPAGPETPNRPHRPASGQE